MIVGFEIRDEGDKIYGIRQVKDLHVKTDKKTKTLNKRFEMLY